MKLNKKDKLTVVAISIIPGFAVAYLLDGDVRVSFGFFMGVICAILVWD